MTWSSRNGAPRFKCIYLANNIINRIHTNRYPPSACVSLAEAREEWAENPVVAIEILVVLGSSYAHIEVRIWVQCVHVEHFQLAKMNDLFASKSTTGPDKHLV